MTATALRLPRVEPARAARQTAIVAALGGRTIAGVPLSIAPGEPGEARGWVCCAGGIAIAPLVAAGRRLPICADDGAPDAALGIAALAAIEPLLGIIEAALGTELLPESLAAAAPDGVVLRLAAGDERLLVGVPDTAPWAPVPGPPRAMAACWDLVLAAPPLRRRACRGDLLLGVGAAMLRVGNWRRPAVLAGRAVHLTGNWRMAMDEDAGTASLDPATLELPVSVRIAGAPMAVADLARLGPGSVLELPGPPGQVAVTVMAGGTPIGSGTLVAIGEGHGVLFDRVFAGPGPG